MGIRIHRTIKNDLGSAGPYRTEMTHELRLQMKSAQFHADDGNHI